MKKKTPKKTSVCKNIFSWMCQKGQCSKKFTNTQIFQFIVVCLCMTRKEFKPHSSGFAAEGVNLNPHTDWRKFKKQWSCARLMYLVDLHRDMS